MKIKHTHWFEAWISGDGALNFTIGVVTVLLTSTYFQIFCLMTKGTNYLYLVPAFGCGLSTFIAIRRAKHDYIKWIFCIFEGVGLFFLYSNSIEDKLFWLPIFIALLVPYSLYNLGYISTLSYKEKLFELNKYLEWESETVSSRELQITELESLVTELKQTVQKQLVQLLSLIHI
jgi:hypothetical protein